MPLSLLSIAALCQRSSYGSYTSTAHAFAARAHLVKSAAQVSIGGRAARSSPATRPPATVVKQARNPRRDMLLLILSSSRSRCSPRKGDREAGGAAPFVRRAADRVPYPHVEREAVQGRWSFDLPDRAHQRAVVGLPLAHALPVHLRNIPPKASVPELDLDLAGPRHRRIGGNKGPVRECTRGRSGENARDDEERPSS